MTGTTNPSASRAAIAVSLATVASLMLFSSLWLDSFASARTLDGVHAVETGFEHSSAVRYLA